MIITYYLLYSLTLFIIVFFLLNTKNLQYIYCSPLIQQDKNNDAYKTQKRVFFFRKSEPFLTEKDAKKFIYDTTHIENNKTLNERIKAQSILFLEKGNQELLLNAKKQAMLNGKKGSFLSFLKAKSGKMRIHLHNLFAKWHREDYLALGLYLLLPLLLVCISQIEPINIKITALLTSLTLNPMDWFFSQLSLTFITISVMSIFSDGDVVVYWQNIVKQMLIEPPARCFRSYFIYSFIYLLGSTIAIFTNNEICLLICFFFNIMCLFDLSKIMINCYYGQNSRKKKLLEAFIKDIEKANVVALENKKGKTETDLIINQNCIEDVVNTFDNFYYYTNDSFNKQNYMNVKENLAIYGTLLARVNAAAMSENEFPLMDWYNDKTYKAYRKTVENYYKEYESLIMGNGFSATSALGNGIEQRVIQNIILTLSNDIHYPRETTVCFELLLYKFYVSICYIARQEDFENLHKYFCIENQSLAKEYTYKDKISENIKYLCKALNHQADAAQRLVTRETIINEIASFIAGTIMIDTKDCYILNFSWLPLNSLRINNNEAYAKILLKVEEYVTTYSKNFSIERVSLCKERIKNISFQRL